MPYTKDNPPERIKHLPKHAQSIWISAYNAAYEQYDKDEERANKVAWAATKKQYKKVKDKWIKKASFSFSFPICLADAKISKKMKIHVIPVGEWKHAFYGDMKITAEDISEFVQHFNQKIRKGVYITEGHGLGEQPALGWFTELMNKGEDGLWGTVEWTKKGRELLEDKAYKYFSPEFFNVYEDPETHKFYNNVLTGGALTNSPYFKELESIVMSEKVILDQFSEENIMSKEQKEKKLSEDEENTNESEEKSDEKTETEELSEKVTYRESEKKLSEKVIYQVINPANIELSEKQDLSEFKKELLRVGTWKHNAAKDGVLNVTKEMLQTIVKNFKDKVLDNVYVPLGHPNSDDPSKNTGEVVDLNLEGEKLIATVDIKDEGVVSKIKKGLIKCVSASIADNYMKKDTGENVGQTLFHAALVSEPYIKGMTPFVALSEEMKDSIVVPIMNMVESLTLDELSGRVKKLEDKDKNKNMSEETPTKSETSEETPKEETSEEETPKEEASTEEAPKEETPVENSEGCKPCGEKAEETPIEIPVEEEKAEEKPAEETPAEAPKEEIVEEKSAEETSEETPKEEVSEGETEEKEEKEETKEEVALGEEATEEEETKSPDVSDKAEEGEAAKTETEEAKPEETETEAEEAKDESVDLAEAEKMFVDLLHLGKVTPAEKVFVLPLLASKSPIELSEGETVVSGKAMFEYLKKQSPKFSLTEEGTSENPKATVKKEEEIPEDVAKVLDTMMLSDEVKKEVYKEFKEEKEGKSVTAF